LHEDERKSVKQKAESAANSLNSIFGGFSEYSEELLRKSANNQDAQLVHAEIYSRLDDMVKSIQAQRPGGLGVSSFSQDANTVEELSDRLRVFTQKKAEGHNSVLWPFIKIMRIYLASPMLETGVVLADLPGIFITNLTLLDANTSFHRTQRS
jgi:hypothetical protein